MRKIGFIFLSIVLLCICACNGTRIYVSPDGLDSASGTERQPVQSIAKALELVSGSEDPAKVILRAGRYEFAESFVLDGVSNVSIEAYPGEEVTISGGVLVPADAVKPLEDEAVLARIKPEARSKAKVLEIKDVPAKFVGMIPMGFNWPLSSSRTEILIDGKALTPARWPKGREEGIDKVLEMGKKRRKNDTTPVKMPCIGYDNDTVSTFAGNEGLFIWGYFGNGYSAETLPVAVIDKAARTMTMGATAGYGFHENTETDKCRRWALLNVLEEMTEPGECVVDTVSGRVYFIEPEDGLGEIEATVLDTTLVMMNGCSNVTFHGITFQGGRHDGIAMEGCSDCVLDHCTVRNFGRLGVHIGRGAESVRNGLRYCELHDLGAGGVELFGGDRVSLSRGDCFVENCSIHNVNKMSQSYRPHVEFGECGNRVSHCELYDAPSMAILFNGNNQLIEYTDIHDACKQISDQGAIYYGRNPTERGLKINYSYIHDVHSGFTNAIFGIYHDDGACGLAAYGCILNNIEAGAVDIGGGSDISYQNCIFMNTPAAFYIDDRIAINGTDVRKLYGKKFDAVNSENAPYVNEYPEIRHYFREHPERPKRIIIKNNIFYNIDRFWEAYVLHSVDYLDNWERYGYDLHTNPGFIDPEDPMKGLDMKAVNAILPDFKPIPFDKIGIEK